MSCGCGSNYVSSNGYYFSYFCSDWFSYFDSCFRQSFRCLPQG